VDDAVRIVVTPETPTAVVAETTSWAAFPQLWGGLLAEVWTFLRTSELTAGRNVMLYRDDLPTVEVGVEVDASFTSAGHWLEDQDPALSETDVYWLLET
jgi:hypothetical protein